MSSQSEQKARPAKRALVGLGTPSRKVKHKLIKRKPAAAVPGRNCRSVSVGSATSLTSSSCASKNSRSTSSSSGNGSVEFVDGEKSAADSAPGLKRKCARKLATVTSHATSTSDCKPCDTGSSDSSSEPETERVWYCYMLGSADRRRTYTGITTDVRRRLQQHNGGLSGGAKATRSGRPWQVLLAISGFRSKVDACCFEWRLKRTRGTSSAKLRPNTGSWPRRAANVYTVLGLHRWTQKCEPSSLTPLLLTWYESGLNLSAAELSTMGRPSESCRSSGPRVCNGSPVATMKSQRVDPLLRPLLPQQVQEVTAAWQEH